MGDVKHPCKMSINVASSLSCLLLMRCQNLLTAFFPECPSYGGYQGRTISDGIHPCYLVKNHRYGEEANAKKKKNQGLRDQGDVEDEMGEFTGRCPVLKDTFYGVTHGP